MNDKPEKFLFDLNDFSGQKPVNAKEEDDPVYKEEDLNLAREESFKLGVQDATQKIRAEHEERNVQALEALTQQLVRLINAEETRETAKNLDTARLTLSIVKKLMPNFSKKYAQDEIIALIKQSLSERSDEPRLVVTVHDSLLEPLKNKIDEIAASQAFQGKVVVIADETMRETDCRAEWADGGIEKDFNALYNSIEQAFHTVLNKLEPAAPSPAAAPETEPEPELTEGADHG